MGMGLPGILRKWATDALDISVGWIDAAVADTVEASRELSRAAVAHPCTVPAPNASKIIRLGVLVTGGNGNRGEYSSTGTVKQFRLPVIMYDYVRVSSAARFNII
jgi:hypothetical protein